MVTTSHFDKRIAERTDKHNIQNFLAKAVSEGLYLEDLNPTSSLYRYLVDKVHDGYHAVVHNNYVIIQSKDDICITLLNLPKKYHKKVDKAKKNKTEEGDGSIMETAAVSTVRQKFVDNGAKQIVAICDNNEYFNNIHEYVMWDDGNGLVWSVGVNYDQDKQPEAPFSFKCSEYANIQYLSCKTDKVGAEAILDSLIADGALTANQKEYIMQDFLTQINNLRIGDIDNRPDVP